MNLRFSHRLATHVSLIAILGALAPAPGVALAATPPKAPADKAAPASREAQADAVIRAALAAGPYPGISVAVEQHGRVVYSKGFGFADVEHKTPVTPAVEFPVGSITKSFTCLSVAQLTTKGLIDLDQTAGHYLPDLPAPAKDAKVRTLLNHTSGLVNYTDQPDFPHSHPVGLSQKDMLGYFAGRPLMFEPGTRFSYTNSGAFLLGMIIEKVSGQPYDAYVRDHVFAPFGMTHSNFDAHATGPNRARGYSATKDGFKLAVDYDYGVPYAAGAIVSTTGDLLKYREGVFGPKTSDVVRKQVLTHRDLAGGEANPYAYGCLVLSELDGHKKITHAGDIYGFGAQYAYYPNDDLTVVILTNNQGAAIPPNSVEHQIARVFLGLPAPKPLDLKVPDTLAAELRGDYAVGAFRFGVDVLGLEIKDGMASIKLGGVGAGGPAIPLRYQGGGRFVSALDAEHLFDLTARPDGSADMVMHYYEGAIGAHKAQPKS